MTQKVIAIVQARMNSSRLPGKSLLNLAGKTLIEHVAERVHSATTIDKVVFAIPDTEENRLLHHFLSQKLGETVYLGSEKNVLERFAQVVEYESPTHVVRITADDPLKDPAIIDYAVRLIVQDSELCYVTNSIDASFPEGIDVEAIKAETLIDAYKNATEDYELEHVTPFIWSRPNLYKSLHFRSEKDLSNWRWTLDDFDDWIFLNSVLEKIDESTTTSEGTRFDYNTIVKLLEDDTSLLALMPQNKRSVGKIISDRIKNAQ